MTFCDGSGWCDAAIIGPATTLNHMPEGDTIWRVARQLDEQLRDHQLVATDFRVPRFATVSLASKHVLGVRSRGKHLLIDVADGGDSPPSVIVHSTLGMDGAWRIYQMSDRWSGGPGHQIRAVIKTPTAAAVGYRLPHVDVFSPAEASKRLAHLGPDLLGADWDPARALANLEARPAAQIGSVLLDQRVLAGIGNVYKSELCFLARTNPWVPVSAVPELSSIVANAHQLLMANRQGPKRVTTGDPRHPLWVYGRHGQPCRVCGTAIRVAVQGTAPEQRRTWWCPTCQSATHLAAPTDLPM